MSETSFLRQAHDRIDELHRTVAALRVDLAREQTLRKEAEAKLAAMAKPLGDEHGEATRLRLRAWLGEIESAELTKSRARAKNHRAEIRRLIVKLDTINEWAKNGVSTHYHNALSNELGACKKLLGCETFEVANRLRAFIEANRLAAEERDSAASTCGPVGRATFAPGWKTGDRVMFDHEGACETGTIIGFSVPDTIVIEADVPRAHHHGKTRDEIRHIPPEALTPTDGGNRIADEEYEADEEELATEVPDARFPPFVVAAVADALKCQPDHVVEAVRMLVTAHEATKRERDALDLFRDEQAALINTLLTARGERAERAEAERDGLKAKVERVRHALGDFRVGTDYDWTSLAETAVRKARGILEEA